MMAGEKAPEGDTEHKGGRADFVHYLEEGEWETRRWLLLFSCWVVSDSLWPHGLQQARLPCPSPSPWVCSNSCPLSRWCHPTISFSVVLFSSCLQSFPAWGSFPMSWIFASGVQSISFSFRASNEYSGFTSFRIDWFDLLAVQGTKSLLQHHSSKGSILQRFFMVQLSHPYMTTGKTIALSIQTLVGKVMSLSRFVIAFLPKSKRLLISWLQSPSAVILDPKKIKAVIVSTFPPVYLPCSNGTVCHDLFECWVSGQFFHSPLSPSSRGCLVPLPFLP